VVVGNGTRFGRALAEKLKGTVRAISQFGTVSLETPVGVIDVVTARSEKYASPGALPDVTPSGIEDDLARRDFSVNAMALSIMPGKWGTLLDPQHGFADCARRKIRALHEKSFQDDPTRMLRAVRYEVRLGFKLAVDTAEWLERDLHFMDRLSPARVLAELRKLLEEPKRAEMLRRADQLGVLGAVSPALRVSETGLKAMEQLGDRADELLYVACLSFALTEDEAKAVIARLEPNHEWREVIHGAAKYRDIAAVLEMQDLSPSEVVDLLAPVPAPVLEVLRLTAPKTGQREHIDAYLRRHRDVRAELKGDDLAAEGVPQGPLMGQLLQELRNARLDGKVSSREQELAHVRRRLPVLLRRQEMGSDRPAGAAAP
jgi:tRNA nucleotidyltransferase (CCA-adding enzyme)